MEPAYRLIRSALPSEPVDITDKTILQARWHRSQKATLHEWGFDAFVDTDEEYSVKQHHFAIIYDDQDLTDRRALLEHRGKEHPGVLNAAANLFRAASALHSHSE